MPEIVGLSIFQGLINAFDMPARQSFLVQMVNGRTDLSNAIALNSTMVNAARLLGPALAGITIAAVGEGYCFLIDGLSYFAVIASLLAMRIEGRAVSKSTASLWVNSRKAGRMFPLLRPSATCCCCSRSSASSACPIRF